MGGASGADRLEKVDDGVVEEVVAIAGDHVSRARDIDHLCVRHELQQFLRALLAEEVADPAPHEQGRQREAEGRLFEAYRIDE